ncbi:MAG: hypothetical protein LC135_03770 [Phycisphaerae bacterium]|jgi:hypothetical protein|nr:hypothetical protein [Phycisphaerae bacterium]MCZ2398971.1 hypothetical protein [Phycisphaerae bacterium]
MTAEPRQLSLVKGRERYLFSYHRGQEAELIASFVRLAEDARCGFTWLDAAILSFQVERQDESAEGPADVARRGGVFL